MTNISKKMKLFTAKPRGFCAGVIRAEKTLSELLKRYSEKEITKETTKDIPKETIYVRKQIVHNKFVINHFTEKGIRFVDELDEIPDESIVVFSAHGVGPNVRDEAKNKNLRVVDATCPFVTAVHKKAIKYSKEGCHIIFIGSKKHEEAEGTTNESIKIQSNMGLEGKPHGETFIVSNIDEAQSIKIKGDRPIVCLSQTTLNIDETEKIYSVLKSNFKGRIRFPNTSEICYATKNRQDALKNMIKITNCDPVFIIGSKNSSNSKRLVEVAKSIGSNGYLIDSYRDIDEYMIGESNCIGLSSGASAPDVLFNEVVSYFQYHYQAEVKEIEFTDEKVKFDLPEINF